MSKHGGAGQWIYLPIVIMGATSSNRDRVRVERRMIRKYGTLNVAYSLWGRPVRKKPRHRPVMRLRGGKEQRSGPVKRGAPTWYTANDGVRIVDFAQVLERCYDQQQVDTVTVTAGTYDVSRTVKVKREFGTTPLMVYFADGHTVKCMAKDRLWLTRVGNGYERVTKIQVGLDLQVYDKRQGKDYVTARLKHLSRHTNVSVRRVLGGASYSEVRHLYNRANQIKHDLQRKIAQANLRKHAKVVWGVSLTWKPVLRVESTQHGVVQAAVAAATALIQLLEGPRALKRDLVERLRAVRVKPKSISRVLCNWRPECRKYSATHKPE